MNPIEQAIARERHDVDLWQELRPERAAQAEVRIRELQTELAELRREEMEILERHEAATKPKQQDTPVLIPLGADEWVDRQWIRDESNQSKRPR